MIKRHDSLIVQTISHLMIPIFHLFGLYVLFHGHYSPGGGFQAGVMIGAALVLEMLVGTQNELKKFSISRELQAAVTGLLIYGGIGALALFSGGEYLNYEALSFLGKDPSYRRYWAILIAEIGVTLTVSMTVVIIFQVLAFFPEKEKVK